MLYDFQLKDTVPDVKESRTYTVFVCLGDSVSEGQYDYWESLFHTHVLSGNIQRIKAIKPITHSLI